MKKTITASASTFIPAPPEIVFDIFTHYDTYKSLVGVRNSRLVKVGTPQAANGFGAIRELDLGFALFREQVIAIDRPNYWDYKFIEWPLPFAHIGGRMQFDAVPGGTLMKWDSTIEAHGIHRITLPLIGWLSGKGLKLLSLQMKSIVMKKIKEIE